MNKKIIAGFGSLLVVATPIIAVTSCGEDSLHKKYDEKTNEILIDYSKLNEYNNGNFSSERTFKYNEIKRSNLSSRNNIRISSDAHDLENEINTLKEELIASIEKDNRSGVSVDINAEITFQQQFMRPVNLKYKYTLVENKDSSSNPFFVADINTLDFDTFPNTSLNLNNDFYDKASNDKKETFLNNLQPFATSDIEVFEETKGFGQGTRKTEVDIYKNSEWTTKVDSLNKKVESFLTKVARDREFASIRNLLKNAAQNMIKDDLEENTTDLTPIRFRRKHPIDKFIK